MQKYFAKHRFCCEQCRVSLERSGKENLSKTIFSFLQIYSGLCLLLLHVICKLMILFPTHQQSHFHYDIKQNGTAISEDIKTTILHVEKVDTGPDNAITLIS